MTFTLLPAVDVAAGRVVQLAADAATGFPDSSPRAAALAWQAQGAEWIHLVDLDAAFDRGTNTEALAAVIGELDIDVQLSGGIRDEMSLGRALGTGCARVNLATAAIGDLDWCARVIDTHGDRIAVSLDVSIRKEDSGPTHHLADRGGRVAGDQLPDLWGVLDRLDRAGCARYVVTDVGRDGLLQGPNMALYDTLGHATPSPVIASGGIASIDDLVELAEAATSTNLEGSIVGTALYAGRFTLHEALAAVGRHDAA